MAETLAAALDIPVLVTGWSRGRVKTTGRMFNNRWVMAFSVRDGKITQFEEYADTQALAAAHEHRDHLKTSLLRKL